MPSDVRSLPLVQVLYPLIEASRCITVPGAYFGDEGKGKTVDALARSPPGLSHAAA
jgi:adenylosuccinate synthase